MRLLINILVIAILIGAGAFYLLNDESYTLKFTEPQLRNRLAKELPFSETYFFVFNVTLENPRIDLLNGSDRIAGGIDAAVKIGLGESNIPIAGALDISGGVRYEPSEGAFYMADPRIERIRLPGVPDTLANQANQALSLALTQFYAERPIYVLSPDDFREAATKLVLHDVTVKGEVLHVTLGIGPAE